MRFAVSSMPARQPQRAYSIFPALAEVGTSRSAGKERNKSDSLVSIAAIEETVSEEKDIVEEFIVILCSSNVLPRFLARLPTSIHCTLDCELSAGCCERARGSVEQTAHCAANQR